MTSDADTTTSGRIVLSRRQLLAAASGVAAAVGAGLASTQSNSGVSSVGGASDQQPSVPVENILVVLEQRRHAVHDSAGQQFHGVDVRDGGELSFADGDELTTIPSPS